MLQPEAIEKQAGWGKIGGIGKMPQPEASEKQAGWGKNGGTRKKPQSEDKIKRDASFGCLEWEGRI